MADVVVIVPVLHRPHRAALVAASLLEATPPGAARLLFVATEGDTAEIDAVEATGADLMILPGPRQDGDWARKINAGYRATTEPIMLLAGDDIHFHSRWLPPILRKIGDGFHVIGTNDLGSPRCATGEHSTHPAVTRTYADEYGTIDGPGVVHEGYTHNFVDDELVGTAKHRRAWVFCPDSIVEHLHFSWRKAPNDQVYELGRQGWVHDRSLHAERRVLWTDEVMP